jgi:hypothetical protein
VNPGNQSMPFFEVEAGIFTCLVMLKMRGIAGETSWSYRDLLGQGTAVS